jgi:hypothetical protein
MNSRPFFKPLIVYLGLGILTVYCRSTTPMSGVSSAGHTSTKANTGVGITLTEATSPLAPGTNQGGDTDPNKKNNLQCIFGKSLDELANSGDFEVEKRGTIERAGASKSLLGKTLLFAYTEYVHKITGLKYSVFNTFLKSVDGGMSKGWIQATLSQEVVAEIDDGEIQNCAVISSTAETKQPSYLDDSCLFGFEVQSILQSTRFTTLEDREVFRVTRISNEAKKRQKYRFLKISDTKLKSGDYAVYLRSSDIQGSKNFNGWIETAGDGKILALVGESEIYECVIDSQGLTLGSIQESPDACIFGKDFLDLEVSPDFSLSNQGSEISMLPKIRRSSKAKLYKRRILGHKPSGKSYVVFHTYRDEDDDGKTQGWIEAIDGRIVAEIFETAIRNCHP